MKKLSGNAMVYGLFTGMALIMIDIFLDSVKVPMESSIRYLIYPVFIGVLSFGLINYKKSIGGYISFGKSFQYGILFSLIVVLLSTVFAYIKFSFINPEIIELIQIKQREAMEQAGNMSDEQIEQAMSWAKKFTSANALTIIGFFVGSFFYTIISLVLAAIVKKDKPMEF